MADLWTVCDIEEGDLSDYTGIGTNDGNGTATNEASSTVALNGSYSHHTALTDGSGGGKAVGYMEGASVEIPANGTLYVYWRWYLESKSGSAGYAKDLRILYITEKTGWTKLTEMAMNEETGAINFVVRDSTGANSDVLSSDWTPSEDTEYELEILFDCSGTDQFFEFWADGVSQGTWTGNGKDANADAETNLRVEIGLSVSTWHANAYADTYQDDFLGADARIGGDAGISRDVAGDLPAMSGGLARKLSSKRAIGGSI